MCEFLVYRQKHEASAYRRFNQEHASIPDRVHIGTLCCGLEYCGRILLD